MRISNNKRFWKINIILKNTNQFKSLFHKNIMKANYIFLIERRKIFGYNKLKKQDEFVCYDSNLKKVRHSSNEEISETINQILKLETKKTIAVYKVTNLPYLTKKTHRKLRKILEKTSNVPSAVFNKAGISVYGKDNDLEKIAKLVDEYPQPRML